MSEMIAGMNAGQFFWSQIDKDGTGKIDNAFEKANAEGKGFTVRDDMTEEEFITENKSAIQKRALFDMDYAKYQFEQAGHPTSSSEQTVEQLSEDAKAKVAQLQGERPSLEIEAESGNPVVQQQMSQDEIEKEKEGEEYVASKKTHIDKQSQNIQNPLDLQLQISPKELANATEEGKEEAKAAFVKQSVEHYKNTANKLGTIGPMGYQNWEQDVKQKAEEIFEKAWAEAHPTEQNKDEPDMPIIY